MNTYTKRKISFQHQRTGSFLVFPGSANIHNITTKSQPFIYKKDVTKFITPYKQDHKGKTSRESRMTEKVLQVSTVKGRGNNSHFAVKKRKGVKKSRSFDSYMFKKYIDQQILPLQTEESEKYSNAKNKISIRYSKRKRNSPNPNMNVTYSLFSSNNNQYVTHSNFSAFMKLGGKSSEGGGGRKKSISKNSISNNSMTHINNGPSQNANTPLNKNNIKYETKDKRQVNKTKMNIDVNKYNFKNIFTNRTLISSTVPTKSHVRQPNWTQGIYLKKKLNDYLTIQKRKSSKSISNTNGGNSTLTPSSRQENAATNNLSSHAESLYNLIKPKKEEKSHVNRIIDQILFSKKKKTSTTDVTSATVEVFTAPTLTTNSTAQCLPSQEAAACEKKTNTRPETNRSKFTETIDTGSANKINSFPICVNQTRPRTSLDNAQRRKDFSSDFNKNFTFKKDYSDIPPFESKEPIVSQFQLGDSSARSKFKDKQEVWRNNRSKQLDSSFSNLLATYLQAPPGTSRKSKSEVKHKEEESKSFSARQEAEAEECKEGTNIIIDSDQSEKDKSSQNDMASNNIVIEEKLNESNTITTSICDSVSNRNKIKEDNMNMNMNMNMKQNNSKSDINSNLPSESFQSNLDIDEYELETSLRKTRANRSNSHNVEYGEKHINIRPGITKPTFFESKLKKAILEKFFNFPTDEDKIKKNDNNKLTISYNNKIINEEKEEEDSNLSKTVKFQPIAKNEKKLLFKRNKTTIQMNNFQQIINNNLSFFTNSTKRGHKKAREYHTQIDNSLNESSNYQSASSHRTKGKIIMNVSTGNINIINNISTHQQKSLCNNILRINKPRKTKYPKVLTKKPMNAYNDIFDKTVVLDINSQQNTQRNFHPYIEGLKSKSPHGGEISKNLENRTSEDDCSFSGDEKTEITSVPIFNSKKLEYYNFSSNMNEAMISIERINANANASNVNKFVLEESFYTLFRYNTSTQECIVSYLSFPEIIRLSLTNKFLRKMLKNKLYSFVINLILEKSSQLLRLKIWRSIFHYSSLSQEDDCLKEIYLEHSLKKSPYEEEIKKDLSRTFPDDPSFKPGKPNYKKLFNILNAYSNYNLNIGYAQGLNFLVANALLVFTEENEIFLFIDSLIKKFGMEKIIGVDNHLIRAKLEEIGSLLRTYTPDVVGFLESYCLNHEFFTANWVLTLFANTVKPQILFYIWDFFFIYGWKFVNYFIVAIVIHFRSTIVNYDPNTLSLKMKMLLKSELFGKSLRELIGRTFNLINGVRV